MLIWILLGVALYAYATVLLIVISYDMIVELTRCDLLTEKGLRRENEFHRVARFCSTCHGMGMVNGCPKCGSWSGLGKYKDIEGKRYYFIGFVPERSSVCTYYRLRARLGKKILFESAFDKRGNPMLGEVAVWAVIKTREASSF
ncbi:MAG: hypothetical protein PHO04_02330 [Candidatus Pacebacteria bacterium]|jgi:hypothetical protein|nr:hypothetical protein [Candidatus Paceibacterota bacterium]NMB47484.1 hypothetical protein [Patescibacteria group bacterium]MDD2796568.1 hypothetical protein [Candidatus Paceibacterota bacterium]MDD3048114.1 hypothetical protein [Candidatus Paceibacterota bacterium]MDD3509746.1 hypothetical protein [Candidatus Paceibacterota bacterium]